MDPRPGPASYTREEQRGRAPRATAPRTHSDGELQLIQRMAAGDEDALGELYDRWRRIVFAVALRIIGDPHDAEEVLADTFWQAWRQAPRYDRERGSVGTWLVTMARSRALDRARADVRRTAGDERGIAEGPDSEAARQRTAEPADAPVERAEETGIVRQALTELPAEQRETLELAYFGGLSQSEIAERLTIPLGTVKTRLRLALRKLRDRLAVLRDTGIAR